MSESEERRDIRIVRPIIREFFDFEVIQDDLLRKAPVHLGGNFQSVRLFGGQTVAQSYAAAKKIYKTKHPERLDVNFIAPGNVHRDLYYRHKELSGELVQINVEQDGKVIANAILRMSSTPITAKTRPFSTYVPAEIKGPLHYKNLNAYLLNMEQNEWRRKHGFTGKLETKEDVYLFDWRPVNIQKYLGLSGERTVTQVWARLADSVRDLPITDPLSIPILMSDWTIGHPIAIYHRQLQIEIPSSASLTHKIIFHQHNVNPYGFFFLQFDMDVAKDGTALMVGQIFDENREIVMSFFQNHYFISDANDLKTHIELKSRI
ncbi:unnamed protein product [Bursaphelenchus okinawaensis]|uniref:Acyl-CoA thioesterase-like C-terminal domain-containing protein n=1 Tax=Bursaphelenchus okinawaensis TaxID=465554 RepID=A0A811LLV7_9BILA|nr:unnamed protein product [Bursaphelenchus okinawaensis]CAG9123820.1 unnamed protein product [Bursaphelenchus okinawaensis]